MKKILTLLFIILAFVMTIFNNKAEAGTAIEAPHWKKPKIKVYIPADERQAQMKRAFNKWQNASYGKLIFVYATEGPADINVSFTDTVDGLDNPIGSYTLTIQGDTIKNADIKIATKSKNIKKYSNNYIYTVMLHEIGHALGLPENLRKESSIMNKEVNEKQDILKIDIMKLYHLNGWSWMDHRINQ